MNLILLEAEEVGADGIVALGRGDARARHVETVLRARVGQTVRVGVVGGRTGTAEVLETGEGGLRLACRWTGDAPERSRLDIALAMPRPKVMNRLWPVLAQMGVGQIWVVQARKTEKAYLGTHVLEPERVRAGLVEGLAQARDTRLPEVRVLGSVEEMLAASRAGGYAARLFAHPGENAGDWRGALGGIPSDGRILLAVGPEGGWTPREAERCLGEGFIPMSLGPRILRTDVAVVALLAVAGACWAE
ncbi:MAG: 16S rRNA (uracil(1498)-N(3))-methyltransferase [Kiritimatiellae bacterium]|nr:16S rRNA (uracil(1498)-N(3))-methyltransferase [Kiritimatiellia bacterium]